jgi:hypothetical protein
MLYILSCRQHVQINYNSISMGPSKVTNAADMSYQSNNGVIMTSCVFAAYSLLTLQSCVGLEFLRGLPPQHLSWFRDTHYF